MDKDAKLIFEAYNIPTDKVFYYLYGEDSAAAEVNYTTAIQTVKGILNEETFQNIVVEVTSHIVKPGTAKSHVQSYWAGAFQLVSPDIFEYTDDEGIFVYASPSIKSLQVYESKMKRSGPENN